MKTKMIMQKCILAGALALSMAGSGIAGYGETASGAGLGAGEVLVGIGVEPDAAGGTDSGRSDTDNAQNPQSGAQTTEGTQGTTQGSSQGAVQGSQGSSQGASQETSQGAAQGASQGAAQGASQGAAQGASQGEVQAGGAPQAAGQTDGEDDSWKLILVNKTHPIPEDYEIPELTELQGGNSVDSRIYPALQQMFDDARAQGIYHHVTSSYRTTEKQQQLMDDKISEYMASGYSQEEAKQLAEEWVAIPGTSEHQLGLSVDISADPASGQDPGSVWYWLKLYCWDYGFIIRYPEEKTQITGIINEPWHFRYVGREAALEMKESGQCLEEYLGIY